MAVVWRFSSIQFEGKTLFVGNILQKKPLSHHKEPQDFRNVLKVLNSYFCERYGNKKILIHAQNQIFQTKTNKKGGFHFVANSLIKGKIQITNLQNEPIQILQNYPITFQNTASDFDIISDVDDTIVKSHTAHFAKRIGTILFKTPKKRKVINFTQTILDKSKNHHARVFYLSKSESNLFFILTRFIEHNDLPQGALLLTPYLKFWQLFRPKKGKNYKLNHICFILENSGRKKFILLGDDSQRDIEIYTEIAKKYPSQIKKIYIRQTKLKPSNRQKLQIEKLKIVGVNVVYFKRDETLSQIEL